MVSVRSAENAPSAATSLRAAPHRLPGLECGKNVAMLAIITLHFTPWSGTPSDSGRAHLGHVLMFLTRWAVPFYFVHAGYFFAVGAEETPTRTLWRTRVLRILRALLFWDIFYIVMPALAVAVYSRDAARFWEIVRLTSREPLAFPAGLLFPGTAYHLWFLGAMALALTFLAATRRHRLGPLVLLLGAFVAAIAWWPAAAGSALNPGAERFALVLTACAAVLAGGWLRQRQTTFTPQLWRKVLGAGLAVFGLEIALRHASGATVWWNDQISPALPLLGVGAFAAWHTFGGFMSAWLRWLGQPLSLGIYGLHVLALATVDRLMGGTAFWRPPAEILLSFLSCAAVTALAVRVAFLRPYFR